MRTPGGVISRCVHLSAHHTWTTSEAAGRSSWDALFIRSGLILLATALYSWNIHLLSWLVLSTLTCGPPAEEKPYFQAEVGGVIKKTYSCVKLLNADAFFSSASRLLFCCSDVFLTRDLRSNLCHYQSARPSWCHPDAPSWNTHRPLCLLHLRFSALFSPQSWTCTNTHADARPLTLIHKSRYTLLKQHDAHTLTHKPPPVWGRCSNEG